MSNKTENQIIITESLEDRQKKEEKKRKENEEKRKKIEEANEQTKLDMIKIKDDNKANKNVITKIEEYLNFGVISDRIIKKIPLFVMDDTEDIYVYKNGIYIYHSQANLPVKKLIKDEYMLAFKEKNKIMFPNRIINDKDIPKRSSSYISEVIHDIKIEKHINRDKIDIYNLQYINFKNGLLDLKNFTFIEHTPEILSINQINTKYDPNAKCSKITQYLDECEIIDNDRATLIEYAGYTLTTYTNMQKALLLYGDGSNGKTVFINLLTKILGSDLYSVESLHNLENSKYSVANLYGKTLNLCSDISDEPIYSTDMFKRITGADPLSGERKYQNSFTFRNTAKLLFAANTLPEYITKCERAVYRRWMLIEFKHNFDQDEDDKNLLDKLTTEEEKSGFINLMLEGLKRIIEKGEFSYKYTVNETKLVYEAHANNLKAFINHYLRNCDKGEETEKKIIYEIYVKWCLKNNLKYESLYKFTRALKDDGRKVVKSSRTKFGIKDNYDYYEHTICDKVVNLDGSEMELNEIINNMEEEFKKVTAKPNVIKPRMIYQNSNPLNEAETEIEATNISHAERIGNLQQTMNSQYE